MTIGKKQARAMLAEAKEALRAAKMENASFGWPGETIVCKRNFAGGEDKQTTPTEYIKEKTRPYRQSWIVYPLEQIIEQLERAAK